MAVLLTCGGCVPSPKIMSSESWSVEADVNMVIRTQ